ncbi:MULTISPECIES: magnesium/cobalt transporter CorA [Pseudoalteromonas]|uniref:Magnesium transport protein CorA n=2 Tax=Pseudoalteromonas TaxID=53246 RepID=A0AAD0W7A7_PSEO7|nr:MULTISPECIES: magnesium/cobalt transporter CorA [Pseudoalteromonas]ASD69656.1 magnesium and cobalt transport protein CorA [Pseudoalteromonas piscicida]AUJ72545.1 Magnesium transport protein CorA [Pseudoalteromonas sp. NC201]AXR04848.1 magnesium and cobalt transport protein CorA [Pseudoalteromonas piscicida]KID33858.1 magnesium transporter CorA [Pseudoalteromonas flavipulchra NCIMB 2033 = ATCC BAA-314]KJY85669.1 magnesium transporter CorA [Pseudoalteromonas piscicida]
MLRFFSIEHGVISEMEPSADTPIEIAIKNAHWIDTINPTEEERVALANTLNITLPGADDVEEIEASSRCFIDSEGLHVHALFMSPNDGRFNTVTVACLLQKNCLLTIRDDELADFRLLRLRARKGQVACDNPKQLLVTLFDQKVENHADMLEDMHHQLEKLSAYVLEEEDSDLEEAVSRISRLEDANGKVRLCLMDTQRNISFLMRHVGVQSEERETLREVTRDIETLMSHCAFLFDKVNFLMDSTQGFINIEQNQIIKTFSIASVVFLPPTVVASVYGMNFNNMPELNWAWGYPFAIAIMLLSGFAPYLFFKHKGWL